MLDRLARLVGVSPTVAALMLVLLVVQLATQAYALARDERLAEASLPSLAIVAVGLIPIVALARASRRHAAHALPPTALVPG